MTPEDIEALSWSDTANMALVNLLIRFLESKRLLARSELIGFLDDRVRGLEVQKANPRLLRMLRAAIASIGAEQMAATRTLH